MPDTTDNYHLTVLTGDDANFSYQGYKYTSEDRRLIDRLLWLGAEGHVHNGDAAAITEPSMAPTLTLDSAGGNLPAGTRIYYKYTYLNERGEETAASPESFVDTPAPVTEPSAPTWTLASTGGTLVPGHYYYALSAYTDFPTSETKALGVTHLLIPPTTSTNAVTLTMPSPPAGATGFNIYRRKPGQTKYFHLASIPVATTTYEDDGSVVEDCDRTTPTRNTTNTTSMVTISLPGATPTLPVGYTWKIYRTYVPGDYSISLLHHVVEYTSETSNIVVTSYDDIGESTTNGSPPALSTAVGSPSKILLTDMAEVRGTLPLAALAFPHQVEFNFPGPLAVTTGSFIWVCEFPAATIVGCRATVGRGFAPTGSPVLVDVNKGDAGPNPSFSTIYTTQANRPSIPVGDTVGDRTVPDVQDLVVGDCLTVDLDQVGGGATPGDEDLTVTIYMMAHGFPGTSFDPDDTEGF